MLNEFAKEVHQNAKDHGWWDEERSFGEIIALCHSELSEAFEEYREERPYLYCDACITNASCFENGPFEKCKTDCFYDSREPEGIAVKLADCILRILDYCGKEGIDIESILKIKHEYNKMRFYSMKARGYSRRANR